MVTRVLLAMLAGLATACGDDGESSDAGPGDVVVYQSRQAIQCGTRGLTAEQSAQQLVNGGVDVLRSGCGVITGIATAAVCGIGTEEILLHEIRKENLPDAERLGFEAANTLKKPSDGIGYAWVDCETGHILP